MKVSQHQTTRASLEVSQQERLRHLIAELWSAHGFYTEKLGRAGLSANDRDIDLASLPFTTKQELLEEQRNHPPYGRLQTYPRQRYARLHQTSGTSGQPLRWPDTVESWQWCLDCWKQIYQMAGLREDDRLFFPFSFGPFLGFWSAFESAYQMGRLCLPGGGMSSVARLRFLLDHEATVVLCTPTYALRLAEAARQENIDLAASPVRALIVAGEPGGSVPAIRQRIESSWGARLFDHNGLTEVGPAGVECIPNPAGLHILESEYIVEVIDPETDRPATPGQVGELVITNLGRLACPVIRYRTGDRVRVDTRPCPCGTPFIRLEGGILGRTDDMIHLRGNNLHPSALEAVILRFAEVAEFRVEFDATQTMGTLKIEVEPLPEYASKDLAQRIQSAVRDEFHFGTEVVEAAQNSLPRFEMKAKRIIIKR